MHTTTRQTTASSGYPYELPSGATPPPAAKIKDELRPWSLTERTCLERMIMQHGFNNWGVCQESFDVAPSMTCKPAVESC
ncbi:hypothetical protein BSLG_005946 [Batrachochytrium salamandrivorans]|nr:hypothetical protein BSLG_005946 [Batrachochytrium salamandrivorans]